MAKTWGVAMSMVLALGLMTLLFHGTEAQSGCMSSLLGLTPCLNYVSGNSSTPSSTCCSRLTGVVQSQPQCLCLLLNGTASSYGYSINQTQALALPGACNVKTPPVSLCNGGNAALPPSSSPTGSRSASPSDITPADDTPATPATALPSAPSGTAGTGTASKTVPTAPTAGGSSDASITQKLSRFSIAFALLFAPHFTSIFGF
ncbi:hypothetical protein SAY87_006598 [Trapa incisa]|uniref:Bifunctional inhibitor/plant lipid transfer protein/seed storage helical domain-containing protein n=2 Tax=Trapa TaxID=22665 RepID=A0AAN7KYA2_TRANT|nr:hypothetical protein SAY87_006598 [Trapa incisa]KAK4775275.1 hypothetical protein SAY86_010210 [Trapa natans]